jgi:putative acyl-CoA dehydrogenase
VLAELRGGQAGEARPRYLTQRLALAVQASLLLAGAPASSCEAFLASRLAAAAPAAFGTLPAATDYDALIERTFAP